MRGFPLHGLLVPWAELVGRGRVRGRLLDLGRYPAAVPDPHGEVRGEVYRIRRDEAWAALDSAEGPQYHRGQTTVRLDGGGQVTAWIFWYRGPLDRAVPVPGGDYRTHAPARALHRIVDSEEATDGP